MAVNVVVRKTKSDNNLGLLRKFSRKVKISGVVKRKKSLRFFERKISDYKKKMNALMRLRKRAEYERLEKLGLLRRGKKRGRR